MVGYSCGDGLAQATFESQVDEVAWQMPILFGTKKTKRQDSHRDPLVWRLHPYTSAILSAVSWCCSNESSCHAVLLHTFSPAVRRIHSWIGSRESQLRGTVLGAAIAHLLLDCCAPADWLTVAVPSDPSDVGWASTDSGGARAFQCLFLPLPSPTCGMTGARRMRKVKDSVDEAFGCRRYIFQHEQIPAPKSPRHGNVCTATDFMLLVAHCSAVWWQGSIG